MTSATCSLSRMAPGLPNGLCLTRRPTKVTTEQQQSLQRQPNPDPPGGRKLIHVAHVAEHTENLGAGKIVIHPVTGDAGGDVRPEAVHGVSSEIQAERNSEDRAAGVRRQLSAIAA